MTAALGKNSYLAVGPAANNLTVISTDGGGLASYELTETVPTREVPGTGDAMRRQSTDRADNNLSITIDLNATTRPLFFGKSGDRLYFAEGIIGNASGSPMRTGSGFMNVSQPVTTDDAIVLNITVDIDGPITQGTFS